MLAGNQSSLLLLGNMQTLKVKTEYIGNPQGKSGKKFTIETDGTWSQPNGFDEKSIEKTLEENLHADFPKSDVDKVVAALKTSTKQTVVCEVYDQEVPNFQIIGMINPMEGGMITGGVSNCDQADKVSFVQGVLDKLKDKGALIAFKVTSESILQCTTQIVAGGLYKFLIKFEGAECPIEVLTLSNKHTLQDVGKTFFKCPKILSNDFREHIQQEIFKVLDEQDFSVSVDQWSETKGLRIVGGFTKCADKERVNIVQKILHKLAESQIFQSWAVMDGMVSSCETQVTAELITKFKVNINSQECLIETAEKGGSIRLLSEERNYKQCNQLFKRGYTPEAPMIMVGMIQPQPMVGTSGECPDKIKAVKEVMAKLFNAGLFKIQTIEDNKILKCKKQVVAGLLTDFTIDYLGAKCKFSAVELSGKITLSDHKDVKAECLGVLAGDNSPGFQMLGGAQNCPEKKKLEISKQVLKELKKINVLKEVKIKNEADIVSCTKQIVNGVIVKIGFKYGGKECHITSYTGHDVSEKISWSGEHDSNDCPELFAPGFVAVKKIDLINEYDEIIESKETQVNVEFKPQMLGGKLPCGNKKSTASEVLKALKDEGLFNEFKVEDNNILSCTKQSAIKMQVDFEISVSGNNCKISGHFEGNQFSLDNVSDTYSNCRWMFAHPPVLGGVSNCPENEKENTIKEILGKLKDAKILKPLTIDSSKIKHCTTQVVAGILTSFTIVADGKNCSLEVVALSNKYTLQDPVGDVKECPNIFTDEFKTKNKNLLI